MIKNIFQATVENESLRGKLRLMSSFIENTETQAIQALEGSSAILIRNGDLNSQSFLYPAILILQMSTSATRVQSIEEERQLFTVGGYNS